MKTTLEIYCNRNFRVEQIFNFKEQKKGTTIIKNFEKRKFILVTETIWHENIDWYIHLIHIWSILKFIICYNRGFRIWKF